MIAPPNREVAIFSAALELEPDRRGAYLAQACADDPALREKLEALLGEHDKALRFLEGSAPAALPAPPGAEAQGAAGSLSSAAAEKPGDRIGRYKLLQKLGEGGCGAVYMAEQQEPVRRRVALKVIKLGMDTKQVIARFEAERQALALMDHPNIAKVLDAGATDTGRPFFVMELVRGIKITDYCDRNNLSPRERLKLFTQVCQAVQHAHQKGIIHRDIKPSNILVTVSEPGAPGCPKIIDFGIAKATTGQHLTDKTVFTAFEQFIGTPAYMSPEQAMMTSLDVDTRTDIYSLGVLLYELLTGKTPLDQKELLAGGLEAMRRTICEKEPVRPSTRLSTMIEGELTTAAKQRNTEAPKLIHLLRGDLDWIVMKALEKDRARRYETANGLAMDVQRYLADEPVVARPPSKRYRFQKLVRRNKLVFATAGAVAVALIIGLAASTWEYLNERTARQRAVAAEQQRANEAAKANASSEFLQQLLRSADPDSLKGSDYTVRQLLDDFSAGLTNQLANQPEVEATVRLAIGSTYFRLGVLADGERNLRRALELRTRALGPQHPGTLVALHWLAKLLVDGEGKWEEGGRLAYEAWQGRQRLFGAEHRDTLSSQDLYEEALNSGGKILEAESIARQVLEIRERVLGPDDYDTIDSLGNVGSTLELRGDYAEGERYLRESLKRFKRIGAADRYDGFLCVKEIAMTRLLQGDAADAEKLLQEVLPRARKRLGPDHLLTLFIQRVLVRALNEEGQLDRAEALGKETLAARRRTNVNQDSIGTARTLLYLGRVLVENHKPDEAEPLLQEALTGFHGGDASSRPELAAQAANWLGVLRVARNAFPEAEALMLPGSERFFAVNAELSPNERRLLVGHICQLYEAWGRPKDAALWQEKLDAFAKP